MTLIVCLDDGNGMLFNNRRQSKDARVCERILHITSGNPLILSEYSAKMFPNEACIVSGDIFSRAGAEDIVFAECEISVDALDRADRLIIYRWNRCYPSDVKFPFRDVEKCFTKVSSFEFSGNSHDLITEEVYVR